MRFLKDAFEDLVDRWNTLIGIVSLLGIAIGSVIPGAENSRNFFIFLSLNAVLWTLIEVRGLLTKLVSHDQDGSTQFSSMREARPAIIERLTRQLDVKGTPTVTVVSGSRLMVQLL